MKSIIFRHYDIRGIVGSEFIIDEVYKLGQALAYYYIEKNSHIKQVLIGMDNRIHSPIIQKQLSNAFLDSGLSVVFIETCPTPVMYFGLHTLSVDAGVMITASHNSSEYNGLKICLGKTPVWGSEIQKLKKYYEQNKHVRAAVRGTYTKYDLIPDYVTMLVQEFAHLKGLDVKCIFDCANGTAGLVLKPLIQKMNWSNVKLLYDKSDGGYPNHEADPTVEHNMKNLKFMLQKTPNAQFGIGFDGDVDRMAAMTKDGYLIPGDKLLAVFAANIFQKMSEPDKQSTAIVFDVRSSQEIAKLFKTWKVPCWRSPAGHASIKEDMQTHNALLGGELSCHFMFKDRYFGYDDGVYAAIRLIEIISSTNVSLKKLLEVVPLSYTSPEFRIMYNDNRQDILDAIKSAFACRSDIKILTIDGIFVQFNKGWGLIRLSHTQPVISLRFEADTTNDLQNIKYDFFKILQPYFGEELRNKIQL